MIPNELMQRTRIKICCIASPEEAKLAVRSGADALGLVGDMPTGPGVIDDILARTIAESIPPPVTAFLLTSRDRANDIAEHARIVGVTTVQIVRHIYPQEHIRLAEIAPWLRRVQVLHVEDASVLELAAAYEPFVHAFLLDSGRPSLSELGGTGRVHDWKLSARVISTVTKPVFLAGGLRAANVDEAITQVRPYGLDVCSGVRTDGRLDAAKLGALMAAQREADAKASDV